MSTNSQEEENTRAIARAIGRLLKSHGFASFSERRWRRLHGDAVQVVIIDRRRVGVHPYQIQILIDFESTGALTLKNVHSFGVAIEFSRIVADAEGFLAALNPNSDFGSIEGRIDRIDRDLRSTALPILDAIKDFPSLKQVKSRYPSQNDMNIVKRMQEHLDRFDQNCSDTH